MKSFIFTSVLSILTVFSLSAKADVATDTTLFFAGGSVQALAHWTQGPLESNESVMTLQFTNAVTHQPMDLGTSKVKVALMMPMMGHGSSPTTVTQAVDSLGHALPGAYTVSKIYFTMGGEWEVHVILQHADGSTETEIFTVNL